MMANHRRTSTNLIATRHFSVKIRDRAHDGEEIGPRMLARMAKHTGLRPEDL
jgi:hypothetical protein